MFYFSSVMYFKLYHCHIMTSDHMSNKSCTLTYSSMYFILFPSIRSYIFNQETSIYFSTSIQMLLSPLCSPLCIPINRINFLCLTWQTVYLNHSPCSPRPCLFVPSSLPLKCQFLRTGMPSQLLVSLVFNTECVNIQFSMNLWVVH